MSELKTIPLASQRPTATQRRFLYNIRSLLSQAFKRSHTMGHIKRRCTKHTYRNCLHPFSSLSPSSLSLPQLQFPPLSDLHTHILSQSRSLVCERPTRATQLFSLLSSSLSFFSALLFFWSSLFWLQWQPRSFPWAMRDVFSQPMA